MSIPLDCLYHYIESVAQDIRRDNVIIYRFYPHGSKKIEDLTYIKNHSFIEGFSSPTLICYDQEPLNYQLYANESVLPPRGLSNNKFDLSLLPKRNLQRHAGNLYDQCLLLHSEKNSSNVEQYQKNQFIPVYYWSHAVISRDWFRYANHVYFQKNKNTNMFLIYNRAWAGTREYRLKFIDLLVEHNLINDCVTAFNPTDPESKLHYSQHHFTNPEYKPIHQLEQYLKPTSSESWSSAEFDVDDYNSSEFEIVLETLFDDSRIQLTEKILRPIACGQPFILVGTTGSLEYLKSYGFKTFNNIIDESYDQIQNPVERLTSIVQLMKEITKWTAKEKLENLQKIKKIVNYNKQYFFSDKILNHVLLELRTNLSSALFEVEHTNTAQRYLVTAPFQIVESRIDHTHQKLSGS
jgi:hypothetical protein